MKLIDKKSSFHSGGVQERTEYQVASNAKMMGHLSDRTYSHKILAGIRELSTNAWDAHVEANNPNPFDVHVPTRSNPVFKIRDYGTGMTKEFIEQMYRVYGESSKTHTNDLQGCQGIGSKSPLAYTSQFTTISYHNGIKYTYVTAKDKRGCPTLNFMGEEETNEPNGVEISYAIGKYDCSQFSADMQDVYRFFPVKPNFINGEMSGINLGDIDKPSYVVESDDGTWGLTCKSGYDEESKVIMGYVSYPIDVNEFAHLKTDSGNDERRLKANAPWSSRNNNIYQQLIEEGIHLYLPIGSVEHDLARENLAYVDETIAAIKKKLDEVISQIAKKVEREISTCETLFDAREKYHNIFGSKSRQLQGLFDLTKIKWNGQNVTDKHIDVEKEDSEGLRIYEFEQGWRVNPKRTDDVESISVSKGAKFYIADAKSGHFSSVKRDMKSNGHRISYLFVSDGKAPDKICKKIGLPTSRLIKTSSIPKEIKIGKDKTRPYNVKVMKWKSNARYDYRSTMLDVLRECWDRETKIDFNSGGFYVELNRYMCPDNDVEKHPYDINIIVKGLKALGITVPDIYGVKTSSIDKYKKNDKWFNFFDWVREQLKNKLPNDFVVSIKKRNVYQAHRKNKFLGLKLKDSEHKNIFSKNSPMKRFVSGIQSCQKSAEKEAKDISNVTRSFKILGLEIEGDTSYQHYSDLEQQVEDEYPMLTYVYSCYGESINTPKIVEYIQLIDSLNEEK